MDERTMATLAHSLQMVGSWTFGWVPALIIFFVRSESRYTRFHALQVMLLQACLFLLFVFGILILFVTIFAGALGTAVRHGTAPAEPPIFLFLVFPFFWLVIAGSSLLVLILTIVYSIKAAQGRWAGYPLLGRLAKRMLKIA